MRPPHIAPAIAVSPGRLLTAALLVAVVTLLAAVVAWWRSRAPGAAGVDEPLKRLKGFHIFGPDEEDDPPIHVPVLRARPATATPQPLNGSPRRMAVPSHHRPGTPTAPLRGHAAVQVRSQAAAAAWAAVQARREAAASVATPQPRRAGAGPHAPRRPAVGSVDVRPEAARAFAPPPPSAPPRRSGAPAARPAAAEPVATLAAPAVEAAAPVLAAAATTAALAGPAVIPTPAPRTRTPRPAAPRTEPEPVPASRPAPSRRPAPQAGSTPTPPPAHRPRPASSIPSRELTGTRQPLAAPDSDARNDTPYSGDILLVEDDVTIASMYQMLLGSRGYATRHAHDGVEGIAMVRDERPALILLDMMMPRMDGLQFLEALRGWPRTSDIPVVILSNVGDRHLVERAMDLGAVEYLVKAQTRPQVLIGALPHWLRGNRALTTLS